MLFADGNTLDKNVQRGKANRNKALEIWKLGNATTEMAQRKREAHNDAMIYLSETNVNNKCTCFLIHRRKAKMVSNMWQSVLKKASGRGNVTDPRLAPSHLVATLAFEHFCFSNIY